MEFEWDEEKNKTNLMTHGVFFEEASEIFDDPFHISILDKRFDYFDERWITPCESRATTANVPVARDSQVVVEDNRVDGFNYLRSA